MQRIQTTHTGSLPRPDDVAQLIIQRDQGQPAPGLPERVRDAVTEVLERQVGLGLDVVNDGEMGREGYATYVKDRLTGFEGEPGPPIVRADDQDHPALAGRRPGTLFRRPTCNGEIRVKDPDAVQRDLTNLREGAARAGAGKLFMTAASPGVVALFLPNRHYASREEYLAAIAEAMRHEYRAIVDAGVILQLDCPDLAMGRHFEFANSSLEEFRRVAALNVEALNHAVRDLPPERMRLHLCWGNYEGPHHRDVELKDIIDIVLQARPAGISVEASNPRHAHEWQVFEDVRLPEGRYVIPGVIDSTNNFVEHPELVAQRLLNYARLLGAESVMAGTDCGFGTFVRLDWTVVPTVVWAKFRSMVDGARIAESRLG
ncbi:MAG: cobalamin-independent methionine synthase II family protein [Candidatus Dormibacteraeota bacterium]|nr:cobalamin-independent methionine synthase II family protein [Candidatus Dormibacteraeota bacterium]